MKDDDDILLEDITKRITPDDWGEPNATHPPTTALILGIVIPLFFFLCGMLFEYWLRLGL